MEFFCTNCDKLISNCNDFDQNRGHLISDVDFERSYKVVQKRLTAYIQSIRNKVNDDISDAIHVQDNFDAPVEEHFTMDQNVIEEIFDSEITKYDRSIIQCTCGYLYIQSKDNEEDFVAFDATQNKSIMGSNEK